MATSEPIGLYALAYYLQRIRSFLESDKKTLSFPQISSHLQDVLVKIITENTEFIHNDPQFNNNAKMEAAKLTAAIEAHADVKLIHEFDDGKHGPNVLVYRKTDVEPSKPLEPLRKPSEVQTTANVDTTTDPLVTTSFKLRCLNATAKFVKDDTQLVMKYPEMEPCQAEFIMNMLLRGKEGKLEQAEVGYGYRSMYAPLWESMKVFSLKYEYKIEYRPTVHSDMKRVVFEKIPKLKKPEEKDVYVPTTLNNSISSHSSLSVKSSPDIPTPKPKMTQMKLTKKQQNFNHTVRKKTHKLLTKMGNLFRSGSISKEFVCSALQRISEFMCDEEQGSLIFTNMDHDHQYFLEHVHALSVTDMANMLFSSDSQRHLRDISYFISKNMLYQTRLLKNGKKKNPLKDVIFEKLARYPTIELKREENQENVCNNVIDRPTHLSVALSQNEQKRLIRLKAIKDKIVQTNGEYYILDRLKEISDFLTKENKETTLVFLRTNPEQALFIKYVHVLSKLKEAYPMFAKDCQELLRRIKLNAQNYELQFHWEIDEADENNRLTNITIKKKPIKLKEENVPNLESRSHMSVRKLYLQCRQRLEEQDHIEMKRSRSLSDVRRSPRIAEKTAREKVARPRGSSGQRPPNSKEKLLEGLNQPVHSDKAVKIMQSMGWTGGALGLRGEGIMEPIMPAIDLATRAGLGHVPKPKKVAKKPKAPKQGSNPSLLSQTAPVTSLPPQLVPPGILPIGLPSPTKIIYLNTSYHIIVLRSMLELVTTDIEQIYFIYTPQTTRPRKLDNFIKQAVNGYNNRKCIGLSDKLQIEIQEETVHVFLNNDSLMLSTEPKNEAVIISKRGYKPKLNIPELNNTLPGRQWYPKTFVVNRNVEQQAPKPQEKLLAAISKPLQMKTTITQKQQVETTIQQNGKTNARIPPDLKTLALHCLQCIRTDFQTTSKTITTNDSETQMKTTIAQQPFELETTIKRKTTELRKSNDQVTQDLKIAFYYLQDIPTDVQLSKTMMAMSTSKTQELNTPNAQKLQEVKTITQKKTKQKPCQVKTTIAQKPQEVKKTTKKNRKKLKKMERKLQQFKTHTYFLVPKKITSTNTPKSQEMKTTIAQQLQQVKTTNIQSPVEIKTTYTGNNELKTTETTNLQMTTTNTPKSKGYIILEKFPANNNDTTQNKNDSATATKETHIVDYMVYTDYTVDVDIKTDINNDDSNNVETVENKKAIAKDVVKNSDADEINNRPESVDLLIRNDTTQNFNINAGNTLTIDSKMPQNNVNSTSDGIEQAVQNDTETVTYNILLESETFAESDKILTDSVTNITNKYKTENNTIKNVKSNNAKESTEQSKTNDEADKDSLADYEDNDDCEIILDDSGTMIEIDSEDEYNLLVSDSEKEPNEVTLLKAKRIFIPRVSRVMEAVDASENVTTNDTIDLRVKTEEDELDLASFKNRKRPSVESQGEDADATKKSKLLVDFKKLCILPRDYPQNRIDNEKASEIQTSVLKAIDYTKEKLPLLSCQGIQNGGLIYSCQDEESLFFMEDLVKTMSDLKIVYEFDIKENIRYKMAFRINSFVEEPVNKIFNRLELYNSGLKATSWGFIKKEQYGDFIVIYVELDESSFNHVCDANFILYAGNDCAKFTIVWD